MTFVICHKCEIQLQKKLVGEILLWYKQVIQKIQLIDIKDIKMEKIWQNFSFHCGLCVFIWGQLKRKYGDSTKLAFKKLSPLFPNFAV